MPRPDRLRVVTFLDTLWTGGAERMAVTIATHLDPERFESKVCVYKPSRRAPLAAELKAAAIPVLHLDRSHRAALWSWTPLMQLLRKERTHVLHSHKFGPNVWGTILGTLARVPVRIAHEHGSERDRCHYAVDRMLIGRAANALVAVSEAERRHIIEVERVHPEKVRVIRNGIKPLPAGTADLRRELGLGPEVPLIGTLAVLRPEKALEVVIDAAALLFRRFPDLHVVIAGEGPEESRLRALARQSGLEGRIHLLGFRQDIANVFAALDVAVFSSDREAMPLATIEAMAAGKAIVATEIDGTRDLIRDGEQGLLVPTRNPGALANAVARLLEDRELRERFGVRAKERQRRELDIQGTVRAFERLYDELFAQSGQER